MNKEMSKDKLLSKHNLRLLYKRKSEVVIVYVIFFALILFASLSSAVFWGTRNLRNLLISNIGLLLITYAQLIVITLGGVDLSVGSIISMVNVAAVTLMTDSVGSWILISILCLIIGVGIGIINGLLVVKGNIQSIIATLATQTIFAGTALLIMSSPKGTLPSELCQFFTRGWGYLFPFLLVIVMTVLIWILMFRTNFGRAIFAVGGSEQAAECSGIRVGRTKIMAFAVSGLISAVAALYISFYSTSGNPLIGESYTQRSITTAVVAGATLVGGKSSVIGCFAAVGIMGIINNLLNLMHVSSYYQFVIQGVILILALAFSAIRSRK